jgi:hypothetical protein
LPALDVLWLVIVLIVLAADPEGSLYLAREEVAERGYWQDTSGDEKIVLEPESHTQILALPRYDARWGLL